MGEQGQIRLTLPDGAEKAFAAGVTPLEVARAIGARLARDAVAGELDGSIVDLRAPIGRSGPFRILTARDPGAGEVIPHSAEHVLADAVKRLWPGTPFDAGRQDHSEKFQYDFRFPRPVPEEPALPLRPLLRRAPRGPSRARSALSRQARDRRGGIRGVFPIGGGYDLVRYHAILANVLDGEPGLGKEKADAHLTWIFGDTEADWGAASPTTYLKGFRIPMLVVAETEPSMRKYTKDFEDAVKALGVTSIRFRYMEERTHGQSSPLMSKKAPDPVRDEAIAFIRELSR